MRLGASDLVVSEARRGDVDYHWYLLCDGLLSRR
jgi:hypothetical protein